MPAGVAPRNATATVRHNVPGSNGNAKRNNRDARPGKCEGVEEREDAAGRHAEKVCR